MTSSVNQFGPDRKTSPVPGTWNSHQNEQLFRSICPLFWSIRLIGQAEGGVDCSSCEPRNTEQPPHQLGVGRHYRQRPCRNLGAHRTQTRRPTHPRIVVVHRRCRSNHVCSSHLGRHHGEPRQSSVPSVSRVLRFRSHHRNCDYLFVPRTAQRSRLLVVRLRRAFHHGPWHSSHARRPSRITAANLCCIFVTNI